MTGTCRERPPFVSRGSCRDVRVINSLAFHQFVSCHSENGKLFPFQNILVLHVDMNLLEFIGNAVTVCTLLCKCVSTNTATH